MAAAFGSIVSAFRRQPANRHRLATVAWLLLTLLTVGAIRADAQEITEYYGTDALGSIRVVFAPDGTVKARTDYLPFGEEWPTTPAGQLPSHRFTGQQRDGEENLDYFNARSLQTRAGRFTTIDPIGGVPENPQSWNRYSYVSNNPLAATDPTGMQAQAMGDGRSCDASFSFWECGGWDTFWDTGSGGGFAFGNDRAVATQNGWSPGMPTWMWEALVEWNNASEQAFQEARDRAVEQTVAVVTSEEFQLALNVATVVAALLEPTPGGEALVIARGAARSVDELSAAAASSRNGLSAAGRALQKHGARPGSAFPAARGNAGSISQQGQNVVDDILTTPGSTITTRHHGRFGQVTEVRAPDGRGLRYGPDGKFIGFLEPVK
jgi:RHS repeat-associated protein